MLLISLIPFHIRFWQCINRYYYTGMWFPHLVNAGKYLTSVVVMIIAYLKTVRPGYDYIYVLMAVVSTIYSLAWDFKMDWGLLRGNKPGRRFLRNRLKYPHSYYYFAMIMNTVLRLTWVLQFIPSSWFGDQFKAFDIMFFSLAVAEAFRRALWSLFRVENENVNNFEKYRTIMEIPKLPDEN